MKRRRPTGWTWQGKYAKRYGFRYVLAMRGDRILLGLAKGLEDRVFDRMNSTYSHDYSLADATALCDWLNQRDLGYP